MLGRRRFGGLGFGRLGMGPLITMQQFKSLAVASVAGGAGVVAISAIFKKLATTTWWPASMTVKAIIGMAVGIVGGRALMRLDRDAGIGFAGAVTGFGLSSLVQSLAPTVGAPSLAQYTRRQIRGLRATEIYEGRQGQLRPGMAGSYAPGSGEGAMVARLAPGGSAVAKYGPAVNGLGATLVEESRALASFGY